MDPKSIIRYFIPGREIISIEPYGSGHINDTFLVKVEGGEFDYILQRVNHNIFKDIEGMMHNIKAVTRHLKNRLAELTGHDPFRETLNLVSTTAGKFYVEDEERNFWRSFLFIPGMKNYETAPNEQVAWEAGRIIGLFQRLLTDLDEDVIDTLPGFHSIHHREGEFRSAMVNDPKNRLLAARDEILFVEKRIGAITEYFDSFERSGYPKRIVHYDTKLNNILFDENDSAACLIDLDTLCPGYVHFDYGDAIRTLANTAPEDEEDLSRVKFNVTYFEAFSEGYLSEARQFLPEEELKLLPFAPIYLTYIIGLRFLTDYLNGDTYYKIRYPEHNLVRARVQFKLVEEMERSD